MITHKLCKCKRCELSGVMQSVEKFSKNKNKKDGLQNFCKACISRERKKDCPENRKSLCFYNDTMSTKEQRLTFNLSSKCLIEELHHVR